MIVVCSECGMNIAVGEISDRLNFIDNCSNCGMKIPWQRMLCDYIILHEDPELINRLYPGILEQIQAEEEQKLGYIAKTQTLPMWFA